MQDHRCDRTIIQQWTGVNKVHSSLQQELRPGCSKRQCVVRNGECFPIPNKHRSADHHLLICQLRSAHVEDFEFACQLNAINMRGFWEQLYGWDEDVERANVRATFKPDVEQIITVNRRDVGIFSVEQYSMEFYLDHIELLPEFQGKGIAGTLIRQLQMQAHRQRLPIRLRVLNINPARQVYEHLGFRIYPSSEKSDAVEHEMVWMPDNT